MSIPVTRAQPDVDVGLPAALDAGLDLLGRAPLCVQTSPVPGLRLAPEALRRAAAPGRPRGPVGAAVICNKTDTERITIGANLSDSRIRSMTKLALVGPTGFNTGN